MLLESLALALATVHFGVPLLYYFYLKKVWLSKPWNIKVDLEYMPRVTIVVPTYMGARYIASRLDNLREQDYPRDRVEVIVVDSASPDGTGRVVEEWIWRNPDVRVKLVVEPERRGKLLAVLEALRHVSSDSEIVVLTDDDCFWERDALRNAVKYFVDPSVGAVSGSIRYLGRGVYNVYRDFYNVVRVAESKWWSTPVHNGPFLALRRSILDKIGLPTFPGADDSAFASYVAFAGYRAIQVDDVWVYEPIVERQHRRMIRRAAHLVSYFAKLERYAKARGVYVKTVFDRIWRIEAYLHVVNPVLLAIAATLLTISAIKGSILATAMLIIGVALLVFKPYRMWMMNQLFLLIALLKTAVTTEEVWSR